MLICDMQTWGGGSPSPGQPISRCAQKEQSWSWQVTMGCGLLPWHPRNCPLSITLPSLESPSCKLVGKEDQDVASWSAKLWDVTVVIQGWFYISACWYHLLGRHFCKSVPHRRITAGVDMSPCTLDCWQSTQKLSITANFSYHLGQLS